MTVDTDAHTFSKLVEDSTPLPRVFLVGGHQGVKLQHSEIGRFVMHSLLIVVSALSLQQEEHDIHELTVRSTHHLSLL